MLFIKTKLGPSNIHGLGLFADQFIAKGTLVQKFIPGFDVIVSEDRLGKLPEPARIQFLKYAYRKNHQYILCSDDARFLNHSDMPNLIGNDSGEETDFAAKDIQIGEELTVNYKDFDEDSLFKLKL